jgi:hypothetical protein
MNIYTKALSDYNNKKESLWLKEYFNLFKTTLTWPENLPPLKKFNLNESQLSFHEYYNEVLEKYNYELITNDQILILNNMI